MSEAVIAAEDHLPRQRVRIADTEMSYVTAGRGQPIVFLHGNPAWSYLWRNVIRRPFPTRASRLPMLVWPRELPIDGEPADVVAIIKSYGQWLLESPLPKLFINAEPGSMLTGRSRDFCRRFPNQQQITVQDLHFIQEDCPEEIGGAVARFVRTNGAVCDSTP